MKKCVLLTFVAVAGLGLVPVAEAARPSGKVSATLFDGKGNKEVLAEATYKPREQVQTAAEREQQPQATTSTLQDGKGRTIRTVETKGDTTVVRDSHGTVVSTSTRNADGSTTVRDGRGAVRETKGVEKKR